MPTSEVKTISEYLHSYNELRAEWISSLLGFFFFVSEHTEMAALLFTSSVCLGLLLTLLAVSVRVTCRGRRQGDHGLAHKNVSCQDGEDEDDEEEGTESSLISVAERKEMCDWEEVSYTNEAAERAERIERREMVIQEIWMNAYHHGSSY